MIVIVLNFLPQKVKSINSKTEFNHRQYGDLLFHDKVIVDAKTDIADDVAKNFKACMEGGFNEI